ncbi:MAG: PEGA domain-containing protein [Methanoregula sp.]|nr:PEGA domain-containing protein [Methanoregula sp.]
MDGNSGKNGFVIVSCLLVLAAFCIVTPVSASDPSLQIYSNPSGANVVVDNFWYDTTPATISSVGNGWHTVYVTMSGYEPYTESVYVEDSTRVVVANLVESSPSYGYLSVTSQPSGADLYVDGVYHGNTPEVVGNLWPGTHSVIVRMAGYYDTTDTVTVNSYATTSYHAVLVASSPQTGSLQIDSTPAGAAVYLDGNYQGLTPSSGAFYINELTPGIYTVTLKMQDYQTNSQSAVVTGGIVNDLHITLVPVVAGPTRDTTGQILVSSSPSGANIYLDNVYMGITPVTLPNIAEGTHTVTLRLSGYQDLTSTVTVVGGSTVSSAGALTAAPQTTATKSPVPAVVVLAAVGLCGGLVLFLKRK